MPESKLPKLKPCPFCGGKAEFDEVQTSLRPVEWSHKVICPECYVILSETSLFKTKEEASKAWNTRASGWIRCSKRMPEDYISVLLYGNRIGIVKGFFTSYKDYYIADSGNTAVRKNAVTHWMPMPEVPSDDRDNFRNHIMSRFERRQ